jgi:hypothetical protein
MMERTSKSEIASADRAIFKYRYLKTNITYLSVAIKEELVSFLAFLAARFSFNERAGFFAVSFLLFRSLDMVVLQMGKYASICITVIALYSKQRKMYRFIV